MRTFAIIILVGVLELGYASLLRADERPNIIYILCDDHRWDALSMMGHPFLETPHIDAMAKNGVQFTNAFVTNSLCSPSRASILTGLYPHNHGNHGFLHFEDVILFEQESERLLY